jgi:hypothetical protein
LILVADLIALLHQVRGLSGVGVNVKAKNTLAILTSGLLILDFLQIALLRLSQAPLHEGAP